MIQLTKDHKNQISKLREKKALIEAEINNIMNNYQLRTYFSISDITNQVVDFYSSMYSVGDFEIMSDARHKDLSEARILSILILRNIYGLGLQHIGEIFSRTHGAIIYLIKKGENLRVTNDLFEKRYSLFVDPFTKNNQTKQGL